MKIVNSIQTGTKMSFSPSFPYIRISQNLTFNVTIMTHQIFRIFERCNLPTTFLRGGLQIIFFKYLFLTFTCHI